MFQVTAPLAGCHQREHWQDVEVANRRRGPFVEEAFGSGPTSSAWSLTGVTAAEGANTSIHLAAPEVEGITGQYFANRQLTRPRPRPKTISRLSGLRAENLRLAGLRAEDALGDACHSGHCELTLP